MLKETLWAGGLSRVDTILHIADIHIRNLKRHDEYRSVFEKLYDICKSKVKEKLQSEAVWRGCGRIKSHSNKSIAVKSVVFD